VVVVPVDDELKYQKPLLYRTAAGAMPSEDQVKAFALANAAPYLHRAVCSCRRCRWPAPTRSTAAPWQHGRGAAGGRGII